MFGVGPNHGLKVDECVHGHIKGKVGKQGPNTLLYKFGDDLVEKCRFGLDQLNRMLLGHVLRIQNVFHLFDLRVYMIKLGQKVVFYVAVCFDCDQRCLPDLHLVVHLFLFLLFTQILTTII